MAINRLYRLDDYPVANAKPDFSGWDLFDRSHNLVGTIEDMLVDPNNDQIRYAIANIGMIRVLVPVDELDPDWDRRCVAVECSDNQLRSMTRYRETVFSREVAPVTSRK